MRNIDHALVLVDRGSRIRMGNPAFFRLIESNSEEACGSELFEVWPDHLRSPEFQSEIEQLLAGRTGHLEGYVLTAPGTGGIPRILSVTTSPLAGGTDPEIIHIGIEDITHRRQVERSVVTSQRREAVGMLASGIAHDFNNFLSIILAQTEMILYREEEGKPWHRELEEIQTTAIRAADLIRQLLTYSSRRAGDAAPVDVNELVRGLDRMLCRVIGKNIQFQTILEEGRALTRADVSQLEQVILNLILNARDAVGEGGRISVKTRMMHLGAESSEARGVQVAEGPYVCIAVSDNGVGMDEATQQRIFDPYFTTKPEGQGTGLGLSTVYEIVKQSHGFTWVDSEPGNGTTIRIFLPALPESRQIPVPESPRKEGVGLESHSSTFLVEDHPRLLRMEERVLKRAGYQVSLSAMGGRPSRPSRG